MSFWTTLDEHGAAPALHPADGPALSYRALAEAVDRLANQLSRLPSPHGRRVAMTFPGADAASVVAYLACLTANIAVHPGTSAPDTAATNRVVQTLLPDIIFLPASATAPAWQADYQAQPGLSTDGVVLLRNRPAETPPHPDLALLLATSGSTGAPQLVRLSRHAVSANARQIASALTMTAGERALQTLPLSYSFGLSVLNSHLLTGGCLVLNDTSVMEKAFWQRATDQRITTLAGVPFTYDILRRIGAAAMAPPTLRRLLQAGGRMAPTMVDWAHETFSPGTVGLHVMYGQTEATARMTILSPDALPTCSGSVGLPLPEAHLSISPDGEVLFHGPNVMMGYAGDRTDLARGDDLGGTLATGDLGRLDDQGRLWLTGRIKRIGKLFGQRIDLDEVEASLSHLGPLAVICDDRSLTIVVEAADPSPVTAAAADTARAHGLPTGTVRVRQTLRLPRGGNGKILYADLAGEVS